MADVHDQVVDAGGRFVEIQSDVTSHIAEHGWPVDVVQVTRTPMGRAIDDHYGQLMQPYTSCCGANIWQPMERAMRDLGATSSSAASATAR